MIQFSEYASKSHEYEADLLLVLPVCVGQGDGELLFEAQACNGIERWAENFSRILVLCPLLTEEQVRGSHSVVWKPVSQIACIDRVKFVPLPYAVSMVSFARAYSHGRSLIRNAIAQSRYLCLAIGGLFGDWGAVACLEAKRMGRPYAVWTDRVEHQVVLVSSSQGSPLKRLKTRVRSKLMYSLERRCIRSSSLGLFHGASCYGQYSPWCDKAYVVHDVHTKPADAITRDQLDEKCRQIGSGAPLEIGYVGRAEEMKGPFDWIEVMEILQRRGVKFQATWFGDGPLLDEMRAQVAERGLGDVVSLRGFVSDRADVLNFLQSAHLLVYCHKTPESPRCHVESLISGCPIAGYESPFAGELTAEGGGVFVPLNDTRQLADEIAALEADRSKLVALVEAAARSGSRFNDEAVFRHRSDLIKKHL